MGVGARLLWMLLPIIIGGAWASDSWGNENSMGTFIGWIVIIVGVVGIALV